MRRMCGPFMKRCLYTRIPFLTEPPPGRHPPPCPSVLLLRPPDAQIPSETAFRTPPTSRRIPLPPFSFPARRPFPPPASSSGREAPHPHTPSPGSAAPFPVPLSGHLPPGGSHRSVLWPVKSPPLIIRPFTSKAHRFKDILLITVYLSSVFTISLVHFSKKICYFRGKNFELFDILLYSVYKELYTGHETGAADNK